MDSEKVLNQYVKALEKGLYNEIIHLFAEDAVVHSPLYGNVEASIFYTELFTDTKKSHIKVLNTFTGENAGAVHFLYTWILADGIKTSFECVDVFEFSCGKIKDLTIIYDTYRVRKAFETMKIKMEK